MTLGELAVKLSAEAREFNKGMTEAAEAVEHTAKRIKRASREVAMVGAEIAAIGAEAVHAATKNNPAAAAALKKVKDAFEEIAAEIGMAALPILKEVGNAVKSVADWFRGLDPALKQNIAKWGAIAAAVLLGVGALGELSGVVAGLAGFVSIAGGILGSALLMPLIALAAILATAVVAVVAFRKAWQDGFQGMPTVIQLALDPLMSLYALFKVLPDLASAAGDAIQSGFASAFDAVTQAVSTMIQFMLDGIDHLISAVELAGKISGHELISPEMGMAAHTALSATKSISTAPNIKAGLGMGLNAGKTAAKSVADGVGAAKDTLVSAGKDAASWLGDAFKGAWKDLKAEFGKLLPSKAGNALSSGEHVKADDVKTAVQAAYALLSGSVQATNSKGEVIRLTQDDISTLGHVIAEANVRAARSAITVSPNRLTARSDVGALSAGIAPGGGPTAQLDSVTAALKPAIDAFAQWLSSDWTKAAMQKLQTGAQTFAQNVGTALTTIGQQLTQSLVQSGGIFGQTVNAAMQGFSQGGIWGALVAVISTLISHSAVFQKIIAILNTVLQRVADMLGSLLSGIEPLMGALDLIDKAVESLLEPIFKQIGQILGDFAPILVVVATIITALKPIFQIFGVVIGLFADVIKAIAEVIFYVVREVGVVIYWLVANIIGPVWNAIITAIVWVVQAIASFLSGLGIDTTALIQFEQSLEGATIDTTAATNAMNQLQNETFAQAEAAAANTAAQDANTSALDAATNSLTNVPEGFKVALAAFNSIAPGKGSNIYTGTTAGFDNQGNPTSSGSSIIPHYAGGGVVTRPTLAMVGDGGEPEIITPWSKFSSMMSGGGDTFNITIVSNDPQETWRKLQPLIKRSRFNRYGTAGRPGL